MEDVYSMEDAFREVLEYFFEEKHMANDEERLRCPNIQISLTF